MHRPLWIRLATFLIWLLAAASAVYWALRFVQGPASPLSAAIAAPTDAAGSVDAQALAKGLGGALPAARNSANEAAPAPNALQANRFVLTGVVVNRSQSAPGVALIAVDGKPPRPYRVGTSLADGVVLHSVTAGKAMLAAGLDAAPSLTLELPALTSAVVGTAVVSRPLLPALAPPVMPQQQLTPTGAPASPVTSGVANSVTNGAANPTPGIGTRPPRSLANRQREGEKEPQRNPAATPEAAPAQ